MDNYQIINYDSDDITINNYQTWCQASEAPPAALAGSRGSSWARRERATGRRDPEPGRPPWVA